MNRAVKQKTSTMYIDLNCENNTLTLVTKQVTLHGVIHVVTGTGTFTDTKIDMHIDETDVDGTYTYSAYDLHLSKQ